MPFVKRNAAGQVTALFREQDEQAKEYLPPNHPDVRAMSAGQELPAEQRPEMQRSDLDMIRVFEDLTDILIAKRIVVVTDFPAAAQEKLMYRKRLRSSLSPISEILGVEEDDGFL